MLAQPWMLLIISALFSVLLAAFLFFYFRHFILIKQKLLLTENELTKTQETERLQAAALLDLKHQIDATQALDTLTGLVTQQIFEDRLKQVLNMSKRHQLIFAVLFLSLNEFKMIINALGNEAGDQILKDTAKRLLRCVRQLDTVARFSNDDFALILPQLTKSETAAYVAQRVLEAMAEPFVVNNKEIFVASSIGVVVYPNDGDEAKVLIKNAEIALHQAKSHGHHIYQFYQSDLQLESRREFILSTSLQQPTVFQNFLIVYQPIINIDKKSIYAMQALLQWNHEDCGLIDYKDFMRLAENNGAIIKIGEWWLRHIFRQFQDWKKTGYPIQVIIIAVSLRQLENPHFIYKVTQLLHEYQIEPGNILFEIAETAVTSKLGVSEKTLLMLKELGIQLGLSDFGTGNMVLWRLQSFQIDTLKIANSIIKNITVSKETESVTKMIMALAGSLGLQVIAEGVETKKQVQILRELGCHMMQGELFCKPLSAKEFTLTAIKQLLQEI